MELLKASHRFSLLSILCGFVSLAVTSTVYPCDREDVIGQYRLANEQQCHRLCWYRQLCSSYSYHPNTAAASTTHNCVLHTNSGKFLYPNLTTVFSIQTPVRFCIANLTTVFRTHTQVGYYVANFFKHTHTRTHTHTHRDVSIYLSISMYLSIPVSYTHLTLPTKLSV